MVEPIIYISHFKVTEGKFESFMRHSQKMTEQIKANKPGTVAFPRYSNQERTELSVIRVFPDVHSFDRYVERADERAKAAFRLAAKSTQCQATKFWRRDAH